MMHSIFLRRAAAVGALGLTCLFLTGCGSEQKSLPQERSGLKRLVIFYGRYISQHAGQPPANEAELKKFIQSLPPDQLKSMGAEDVEKIFLSSRDNKPYVVLYGQVQGPPGPGGAPVIAYEQEGKEGKRWVASTLGAIEEVDEARFRELVPTAKP